MTDNHTLSIDSAEWRVLFASNVQRVSEFVNQNTHLTAEHLKALHDHLDRAKVLASAWCASVPQATEQKQAATMADAPADVAPQKRKGGWPKGQPRKRHNPQVVQ